MSHNLKCGANALYPLDDFPKADWKEESVEDLEDGREICQNCDAKHIRFVHTLVHDDWPEPIRVGCNCVHLLTGEGKKSVQSRQRKVARERAKEREQRANFLKIMRNIFKEVSHETYEFDYGDGLIAKVFRRNEAWHYRVGRVIGVEEFETEVEAMAAAFKKCGAMTARKKELQPVEVERLPDSFRQLMEKASRES